MRIVALAALSLLIATPAVAEEALADLVPQNFSHEYVPDLARPGWVTAYYSLEILNAGDAPVTGIEVDWKRPGSVTSNGMRTTWFLDVTLEPEQTVEVSTQLTAVAGAESPVPVFCVIVDPNDHHPESDELNNLGCSDPVEFFT